VNCAWIAFEKAVDFVTHRNAVELSEVGSKTRMISEKRLMVLGAGPFQAPAIRKAADLGAYVITVDYLPQNIGHKYGHRFVNCSTADKDAVLRHAKEQRINGICTFSSDVAVPTVAYVSEQLNLPGSTTYVAETMAMKDRFRAFLRGAHLTCPGFISGNDCQKILQDVGSLEPPIIVKPVDTSGSRGITRLNEVVPESLTNAFLKAQSFSRSNTVVVEEYVEGTEVGGDAILIDGRVAFIAITHKHKNGFVITGHSLPTNISAHQQSRVIQHIEEICAALGCRGGPLNFDAIVSSTHVTMLEMSTRNGGNGIAAVIERATGVDVEGAAILMALGVTPTFPERADVRRGTGSFVFGSPIAGRLGRICTQDKLRDHVPEIFDLHYAKELGDRIEPFEHNGNLIGFVLFDCLDAADYQRITETISDRLDIAILPD
jgi:biotin carboxylase